MDGGRLRNVVIGQDQQHSQATSPRKNAHLEPVVEFLQTHYDQPIKLADAAQAAQLSISRLAHLFKEQTGTTVIDYLTRIRIDHAKRLLLATEDSCSQICYSVGFNNQSYFTRTFKRVVGMTPQKYRSTHRNFTAQVAREFVEQGRG